MPPSYRPALTIGFVLALVIAIPLLLATAGHRNGPPVLFATAWIAIAIHHAYWFLFRIAYELEFDGQELRWRAPLRSGNINLGDIDRFRPFRFGSSVEVIESTSGAKVLVMVRPGLSDFAETFVARKPGLPIRFGFNGRLAQNLERRSGFEILGE
jgi:hypothetical protein